MWEMAKIASYVKWKQWSLRWTKESGFIEYGIFMFFSLLLKCCTSMIWNYNSGLKREGNWDPELEPHLFRTQVWKLQFTLSVSVETWAINVEACDNHWRCNALPPFTSINWIMKYFIKYFLLRTKKRSQIKFNSVKSFFLLLFFIIIVIFHSQMYLHRKWRKE